MSTHTGTSARCAPCPRCLSRAREHPVSPQASAGTALGTLCRAGQCRDRAGDLVSSQAGREATLEDHLLARSQGPASPQAGAQAPFGDYLPSPTCSLCRGRSRKQEAGSRSLRPVGLTGPQSWKVPPRGTLTLRGHEGSERGALGKARAVHGPEGSLGRQPWAPLCTAQAVPSAPDGWFQKVPQGQCGEKTKNNKN